MAGTLPSISTQPTSLVVTQGNSAGFAVSATGDPPLGYQWRFGGGSLTNATNSTFNIAGAQLSDAGNYDVVVANGSGAVTSAVARLTVRSTNGPVYAVPDGGWTYIYAGNAVATSLSAALDGTWNHLNGDDSWAGDGRGAGNGLAGGINTTNGIVTIEDAVAAGTSGNDNRRFYFTHNISADAGVTNANTLLNDGVTLSFRARLTPASDPLIELTNAPNGFVNASDGKGMFGIRQAGASGMLISFSLNKAVEDTGPTTSFTFASPGLHMNNLNGDVRSANVDPGEGGTVNMLALDPTVFHECWINIQDNGASAGTHRVSIYVDGSLTPTVYNVTAGTGSEGSTFTNYLALGLPSTPQRGAFDVDFFAYHPGLVAPIGFDAPPGIVQQPLNATVAEGLAASFNVGVTGTPQFAFQWLKNGTVIANATNRSYTTPPVTPSDNSAQFVVVVSNDNGSVTSSPPATLTVIPDTVAPSVLSVGSLDGQRIGICFTERVTAASAQNPANYSINGGAVTVNSATLRTEDGGQTAVLNVSGLSNVAGTPFTVVASNIRDISAAGNLGGGSASATVLGLTAADVGIGGTDPLVAGSTFTCASNQLQIVAGGSDIGGGSDGFQYVYQQRTGNFDVIVRAVRLDAANRASKAGLVAREDLTAGSREVSLYVTPSGTAVAADGTGAGLDLYEADYRAGTGGATTEWPAGAEKAGVPYPNGWMRLVRAGDVFTAYQGTNGADWVQLGQFTNVLPTALSVGVGVTAHTNAAGRTTTAVMQDLQFVLPPQIVTQPQSQIVTNGDSVQFSVAAAGAGTLRYQWHLNGVDIPGGTNSTLNLASAHASDAGTYRATVSSSAGSTDSAAAVLTVRLFDYGDAPDSYSTLRASNGARHLVTSGIYLGAGVDVDLDGTPGSAADGDDSSGIDDEDGVRFLSPMLAGQVASIELVASTNGLLNGWIDWNGNGTWADAGEQVFTNQPVQPGTNLLQLAVSRHATAAPTFARFRFSTASLISFNGPAADGEVEDYAVSITPQVDLSMGVSPSANPIAVSSNLVLTLNVSNAGPSRASSVTVSDLVQGSVNFGVITSSRGSCARTGNSVNCDLGGMNEAEVATIQITVIPQAAGQITNQAQVTTVEVDVASGNNSAATAVLVEVPPTITTQPVSQTVTQGNNLTFTGAAQGTAPLFYQWWLNGAPLAAAQSTTLFLTNAQSAQAGDYALQASNRVGSVLSQPAHLTVLVPAGIAQQPQSVTNYAGRTTSLTVIASGSAPLDYQWYFNASNLLSGATNSLLVLTNAQKSQSGNYLVTIQNSAGGTTSSVATVTIVEADFGDAPDSYGTTLASNGARHRLAPGVRLGALADFEGDGQPQSAALGDDLSALSDEDGVIFLDPLYAGQAATVRVIASTNGILNAWLDMQANGNWLDVGDQIITNQSLVTGTNVLVFGLPPSATTGPTFARFRFSTIGALTPFGEAPDGEVEDYQVMILPASDLIVSGLTHPAGVAVGSDLTFGIIVSNRGPSTAHSVSLTDTLPSNANFISASISGGSCSQNSGVVSCNGGDLPVGAALTLNVIVHPVSVGAYTNSTSATASEYDPIVANSTFADTQFVQQPPAITGQPQSLTASNGDNVSLSVQATGTSLVYQWRFNSSDLIGATNATLLLTNIQQSQAGSYMVKVSNLVGQVNSDPASVTVIMPLRITSQPQDTSVVAGNTAILSVVVSGSGPVAYQWFYEGTPIVNGTNATLLIDNAQSSDGGQYVVSANNNIGSVVSDPATLTVIVPPSIVVQPQSQTNLAGSDAVLTVAASGTLPLSYQWSRDGNAVLFGTNDTLTIQNAQKTDSGNYTVTVSNQGGSVTSTPASLTIREMDFGDAPDLGYPTLLAFNGARHVIVPGVHLGMRIDFEPDGQPTEDATGDDLSGNDEDGIVFITPFYVGEVAWLRVVASTNGFLDAWADFNQDGAWVDAIEQIFASQPIVAGTNLLSFPIPATAETGTTFARFRFSTAGGLSYDGEAADGEVEDYKIELLPAVELELRVVESPDPAWVGNTMTYSLAVTNNGPLTATSVTLQDSLSPIASFVSANPSQGSCSNSGSVVICDLGSLANGDWATVDLIVQPITSGIVTNYARVGATEYDLNPTNSVDWRLTPSVVNSEPFVNNTPINVNDGSVAQLYPSTIFVSGVTATVYKVTVTLNNLTHSAPDDFDILLVGPNGQAVILMSDVGGRALLSGVTITFDDFASLVLPDNSPFISQTYKPANYGEQDDLFPAPAPPGPYTNKLSVFRGANPNGVWSLYVVDDTVGDAGLIGDGWSLQFATIDPIADVGVQIADSPHKVIVGSNLTYSIIASNSGPGWASGVRVHDSLPTNVVFISASSPSGSCSNIGGEVDCSAGQIAPGGFVIVTVVASPQQLGVVSNYATVSCNERDFNGANDTMGIISVSKLPVDLVLLGDGVPDPVVFGQNVSYSLTASNRGPNGATGLVLSDTLPVGTTFVSATAPGGSCSAAGGVVTCQLPNLGVGSAVSAMITVAPGSIGRITNAPTVATDEVDLTPSDNRLLQPTTVALVSNFDNSPQIAIASNGAAAPYPASISVSGLTSAVYVVSATVSNIQHPSPDDLDLLLVSPSGQSVLLMSDAGGNTSVSGVTLQFDDRAPTAVPDAGPLTSGMFRPANYIAGNQNFASPAPGGPYPTNLTTLRNTNPNGTWSLFASDHRTPHSASTIGGWSLTIGTVDPIADLQLIGAARPNPVAVGSNLVLTVTVSNRGPAVASDIVLSNQVTPTTPLISASATQGSCMVNDGFVVCALSNLVAGGSSTVTLLIAPDVPGTITHGASVAARQLDLVAANNVVQQSIIVQPPPVIVTQPVSIIRTNGDSGQFAVVATGADPLTYQWRRNGTDLPLATNSSLVLINVTLSDGGTYDVRVSNRVGTTLSAPALLAVKMRPVITGIGPQSTDEDTAKTVPITIGDVETPAGSLQIFAHCADQSLLPDTSMSFSGSGSNRLMTLVPATNQFGSTTVTVIVTDGDGLSASNTFVLTVAPVNDLPVISSIVNQLTDEDTPKVVSFTVADVETAAAALTMIASSSDTNVVPNSRITFGGTGANRTVTIAPAPDQFGATTITLIVNDGAGGTGSTSFLLTVNPVNDSPTIDPVPDQVTDEDVARTVAIRVGDMDSSVANLSVEGFSSNTNLVPIENITFGGSGSNRLVTILPATNHFGAAGITLVVRDPEGGSTTNSFVLTVTSVNDLPASSAIGSQSTLEDTATAALSFTVGDDETAAEDLTLTGFSSDGLIVPGANISFSGSGSNRFVTVLPGTNQSGSVLITVVVHDSDGGASSNSFTLNITPVNDLPVISSISRQAVQENGFILVSFNVDDIETAPGALSVSATANDKALVPDAGLVVSGADGNRTLAITPAPNQFGSTTITLLVADSDGGSVSTTFPLVINAAPVIAAIGAQSISEDTVAGPVGFTVGDLETSAGSLTLSGFSSDPTIVPNANISFNGSGSNRFVFVQPATNQNGSVVITVVVHDSDGGASSNSFTLNITPVNDLPVISTIISQVTDEDVVKVVSFTIGDVETAAGNLIVSGSSSDTGLVPNSSLVFGGSGVNRTVSITPAANQSGSTTITLTVGDADGGSVSSSFLLVVNPVNDSPTLDAIGNLVVDEDSGPRTVNLTGISSGAPNEMQVLGVSAVSSNPGIIPNPVVSYFSAESTGTLTFQAATNANGTVTITVTVNDGSATNNVITRTFQVTVNPINDPPTISSVADQGMDEDAVLGPISFTVADVESVSNLLVTGTSSNTGLVASAGIVIGGSGSSRTVTVTPLSNQSGSTMITLTVRDPQGATASTSFKLTVNAINDAPTISTIANQTIAEDSSSAALAFVVGDAESAAATLVVSARSSNQQLLPDSNLVLSGSDSNRTIRLSPATNQSGSATVTLTVRDAEGLSASSSFVLTVTAVNDAPTIGAIGNQTINEDSVLSLPLTLADIDSAPASLVLSASSSNPVLVPAPNITFGGSGLARSLQITPATNENGSATITVTVSDGSSNASTSFVLTVSAVNDPPTLNAISNLTVNEDAALQTVPLSGISSGAANESQTLSIVALSGNPSLIPNPAVSYTSPAGTGSLSFTPVANASGSALITVTVSDGSAQFSRSFTVTVNPVNDGPSIAAIANQSTLEDTPITIPFTINDIDTAALLLTVSGISSNQTLVPTTNIVVSGFGTNRTVTITPALNQNGPVAIRLTVSDGVTNASTFFTLTVTAVNDPPTLNPLSDINATAPTGNGTFSQTVNLTGISTGATNETETLTVTASSSNTAMIPTTTVTYTSPNPTGTLQLTSARGVSGTAIISVSVRDSQGTNIQRFVVNLHSSANAVPTISTITNRTVNEDTVVGPIAFTISDSVTPATLLTLAAASSNPLLVPTNNILFGGSAGNRTVTLTPLPNQSGTATITISVTDTNFGSVNTNFVLTVLPVNDAPIISPIAGQTIAEDTISAPIAFMVNDVETPASSLVVTATSSNPTLLPDTNILLGGNGTNRALVLLPATNQFGISTITVSVSDGLTNSSTSFALTVNPINDLPTIAAVPDQITSEDVPSAAIVLTVGDMETPLAGLNLSASSSNPALISNFTFGGSGANRTLVITPAPNQSGSATITVTVADTDGGATNTSFALIITPANDLPTLDPINNLLLNEGAGIQIVNLTGISSGAANENQTLALTAVSSNPDVIPNPAVTYTSPGATGSLSVAPVSGTNGSTLITVTVNDGQSQSNTISRSFTVTVNDKPTISLIADQLSTEDAAVGPLSFTVNDRDTSASNLLVTASSSNPALIPDGNILLAGNGSNRTLGLTPLANQSGNATITISATDSNNLTGTRTFVLIVTPANDPPTLDVLADLVINEDAGLQTVNLAGISSGALNENQTLSVRVTSSNPALIADPAVNYTSPNSTGTLTFAPSPNASGTALITVTLNDGGSQNNNSSRSFTVTVNPVNDPPTLDPIRDIVMAQDIPATVSLTGIGAGPNESQPLTITAISSNPGLIADPAIIYSSPNTTGILILTPAPNATGNAVITVTVSDGDSLNNTVVRAFLVTVNPVNHPPTLDSLADLVLSEDSGLQTVSLTGISSGATNESQVLTLSVANSNPALLTNISIDYHSPNATGALNFGTVSNSSGTAILTVGIDDGTGSNNIIHRSFTVIVDPVNDQPTLDPIDDIVVDQNGDARIVILTGIGSGALNENQALTIGTTSSDTSIVPDPALAYVNPGANAALTFAPNAGATGSVVITVTVRDDGGTANGGQDSITRTFRITVGPLVTDTNRTPVLRIDRVGAKIVLSWPADATDFELQSRTAFVSTSLWSTVADVPGIIGGRCFVTNTPTGEARFYQLGQKTVVTNTAPGLRIELVGGNVVISWPSNAVGFVLQSKTVFDSANLWTSVAESPVLSGNRFYVTNSASGLARFYQLARIPAAPQLQIQKSGNDIVVSWPLSALGYVLESSSELAPAAHWSNVSGQPSASGSMQSLTVLNSATARFFRLRSP